MASSTKRKEYPESFYETGSVDTNIVSSAKKLCLHVGDYSKGSQYSGSERMQTEETETLGNGESLEKPLIHAMQAYGMNNNNDYISNNNYLSQQQSCTRCLAGEPGHFKHVS